MENSTNNKALMPTRLVCVIGMLQLLAQQRGFGVTGFMLPSSSSSSSSSSLTLSTRKTSSKHQNDLDERQRSEAFSFWSFRHRISEPDFSLQPQCASRGRGDPTTLSWTSSSSRERFQQRQTATTAAMDLERRIVQLGRQGRTDEALDVFYSMTRPTIRQLNAALDACARARPTRLEQAFEIFQESTSTASDFQKPTTTLPKNHKSKRHTQQLRISNLLQPNVYTFGALMSACARAGQVSTALQLLQDMESIYHVQPNAVVYSTAMSACSRSSPPRPQQALQLLQQAHQRGVSVTVVGYNAACCAAARAGDWETAVTLLEAMMNQQDFCSNTSISNTTTSTTANADDADVTHAGVTVPAPDAVTYGTILSACEKAQEWKRVMHYAEQMQDAGFALDGVAITCVLHACQKMGWADHAKHYLQLMKSSGMAEPYPRRTAADWQSSETHKRPPLSGPDAVAYRLAISACARGGAWQDGLQLLHDYHQSVPREATGDVVAYTAAMTGCEYAGEYKTALKLLDRMRKTGTLPNHVTYAVVLGACATACAKLQQQQQQHQKQSPAQQQQQQKDTWNDDMFNKEAEKVPTEMSLPQRSGLRLLNVLRKDPTVLKPNIQVYNAAIRLSAEAHDLKRAMVLHSMLLEDGLEPTIFTYGALMTACERVGSVDGVTTVFDCMRRHIDQPPNEIIYGAAISACRKAGEAERAMLLLQKMIQEDLQPNIATFNTALMAQVESKRASPRKEIKHVKIIYDLLRSEDYPYSSPNRQTYALMIRFWASQKEPQRATAMLREMRNVAGLKPDVDLYTATVASYERCGQPRRALALMDDMRLDGYDFYEIPVLNAAFKRAIKLVNVAVNNNNHQQQSTAANATIGTAASIPVTAMNDTLATTKTDLPPVFATETNVTFSSLPYMWNNSSSLEWGMEQDDTDT